MRSLMAAWLVVGALLGWTTPARADVVTDWNLIAAQAIAVTGVRQGPSGVIDMAMVQVAAHDAIQAFQHRFESYGAPIANASGSPVAAAATAVYDVLIGVGLTTTAAGTIDSIYNTYLASRGLQNDNGIATGHQARGADPQPACGQRWTGTSECRTVLRQYEPRRMASDGRDSGDIEPHADGRRFSRPRHPVHAQGSGSVPCVSAAASITSGEVRHGLQRGQEAAGVVSELTLEQTDWRCSIRTMRSSTGPAARSIAAAHLSDIGDSGRMFALLGMSMADAVVTAWNTKRYWTFWWPITAIHEAANDGNFKTTPDAAWQPLIATPNYPSYTSGASNVAGAASTSLANYFGTDKMEFTISSVVPGLTLNPRPYNRFSDVADDVPVARIYEAIHYRFDDSVSVRQGKHVANWGIRAFPATAGLVAVTPRDTLCYPYENPMRIVGFPCAVGATREARAADRGRRITGSDRDPAERGLWKLPGEGDRHSET